MAKKLKYIKKERENKICIIDGLTFDYPKTFEDYIEKGVIAFIIILLSPLWVWFYLIARIVRGISRIETKKETYIQLICPVCSLPVVRGDYKQAKCHNCGWYKYTDDDFWGETNAK